MGTERTQQRRSGPEPVSHSSGLNHWGLVPGGDAPDAKTGPEALRVELHYEPTLGGMSDKGEGFLEEADLSRGLMDREHLEWGENKEKTLQAQARA